MSEQMVMIPREVVEFLRGVAPLDGAWFGGDPPPGEPCYWWRKYLRAALAAGEARPGGEWRKLAHQFDAHRMQALAHLRMLLDNPQGHAEAARQFLAAPPQPAVEARPVAFVTLLHEAEDYVRSRPAWRYVKSGSPLQNDIPVWVASFAADRLPAPPQPAEPVVTDEMVDAAMAAYRAVGRFSLGAERMRAALVAAMGVKR